MGGRSAVSACRHAFMTTENLRLLKKLLGTWVFAAGRGEGEEQEGRGTGGKGAEEQRETKRPHGVVVSYPSTSIPVLAPFAQSLVLPPRTPPPKNLPPLAKITRTKELLKLDPATSDPFSILEALRKLWGTGTGTGTGPFGNFGVGRGYGEEQEGKDLKNNTSKSPSFLGNAAGEEGTRAAPSAMAGPALLKAIEDKTIEDNLPGWGRSVPSTSSQPNGTDRDPPAARPWGRRCRRAVLPCPVLN